MIVPKSKSHWVRCFAIVLLVGLFLPASPALAQDGDPGKKPRITPSSEDQQQELTTTIVSGSNLIQDPSFEASYSSSAYWKQSSTNSFVICSTSPTACGSHSTAQARTGSNWVWFGGLDFTEPNDVSPEIGDVYQNVTFPESSCKATLEFYLWIGEARSGSDANDNFRLLVDGKALFTANATQKNSYNSYQLVSVDVSNYANGGVHKVEFNSKISNQLVTFNLDDVSLASNCPHAVKGDYNGDRRADIAVWRPSNGNWFIAGVGNFVYGQNGDIPVPADYNGDGKVDIAVWRPSNGNWFIASGEHFVYGQNGDIPVPADYNGDGKADVAVWRPSNGNWFIVGGENYVYGANGDIPVPADYNGDGKDDIGVFRPSSGTWFIPVLGTFLQGANGDTPVPADYNGDGKAETAVFRPSNSTWYIAGVPTYVYGRSGDTPLTTDYNGDGKVDAGVWRPSDGNWFIIGVGIFIYGQNGDIPV